MECTSVHDIRVTTKQQSLKTKAKETKEGAIAHLGRAPALHAGGGRFESAWLHQLVE